MRKYLNRLPRTASLLAAIVIFSTCSVAFAQQPGESSSWTHETGAGVNLTSHNTYTEARSADGQYLVRAWQNLENNVDIAINANGDEDVIRFAFTQTGFSPVVTWISGAQFLLCQTGTDLGLYCGFISADLREVGPFSRILDLKVIGAVSAAHVNLVPGLDDVIMVYKGSDSFLYTVLLTVATGEPDFWQDLGRLNGQATFAASPGPAITYNEVTQQLYIANILADGTAEVTKQPFGASSWEPWVKLDFQNGVCEQGISIAPVGDPNLLVSCVSASTIGGAIAYKQYDTNIVPFGFGTLDITGWRTFSPVNLTFFDGTVYGLFHGTDDNIYWKSVFHQ